MIIDFIIEDLMLNSYLQKNFHTLTALPLFDPEVCYFPKKAYTSPLPPQKAGPSFLCRNSSPFLFIPEFIEIMAY